MPEKHRSANSRRKKTTRSIVFVVVLCSGMTCLAPVLYASDCSRWIAEYKQGLLQRRAAYRLRMAKYRLTALVHKPTQPRRRPLRHRMGPLESLRRFQIDCGDLEGTTPVALVTPPTLPVELRPLDIEFPSTPPELPPPTATEVSEIPPLGEVPLTAVLSAPLPGPVPEPGSFVLVLTGAAAAMELARRNRKLGQV